MILVAGGDSFVFGAELKDQVGFPPSLSTYSALLANKNNFEYHCVAQSGNANNAISRMVMTACDVLKKENKKVAAIVSWTFSDRYEFRFNYETPFRSKPWHSIMLLQLNEVNNHPIWNNMLDFVKTFYKHVGTNEVFQLYSTLKEILFLQYYFEANRIPYMFTTADNHFYSHPLYFRCKDEFLSSIYDQINWDKWFFFDAGTKSNETRQPRGFYQWAVENKYERGQHRHPLEDAHIDAANLMQGKFYEMVKKPLE